MYELIGVGMCCFAVGMAVRPVIDGMAMKYLARKVKKLREENDRLHAELDRECAYGTRLLDEPAFYAAERQAIESVTAPKHHIYQL